MSKVFVGSNKYLQDTALDADIDNIWLKEGTYFPDGKFHHAL